MKFILDVHNEGRKYLYNVFSSHIYEDYAVSENARVIESDNLEDFLKELRTLIEKEKPQFSCSDCGSDRLEVIMTSAIAIDILKVNENTIEYGKIKKTGVHPGEVNRYQCQNCGKVVKNEAGIKITDAEQLYNFLAKGSHEKTTDP